MDQARWPHHFRCPGSFRPRHSPVISTIIIPSFWMKALRLRGFVGNDCFSHRDSLLVPVPLTLGPGLPLSGQCPVCAGSAAFPGLPGLGLTAVQLDVTQELVHPQHQCEEWHVIYWIRKEWLALESQEGWIEHHSHNQLAVGPREGHSPFLSLGFQFVTWV